MMNFVISLASSEETENGKLFVDARRKNANVQNNIPAQQNVSFRCSGLNFTNELINFSMTKLKRDFL